MKELGLRGNYANTPETYETYIVKKNEQLTNSHADKVLKHFNISLNAENKCLPKLYWLSRPSRNHTVTTKHPKIS